MKAAGSEDEALNAELPWVAETNAWVQVGKGKRKWEWGEEVMSWKKTVDWGIIWVHPLSSRISISNLGKIKLI